MTARNDLVGGADRGLLRAEGRTRGRRYLHGPRDIASSAAWLRRSPILPPGGDAMLAGVASPRHCVRCSGDAEERH